MDPVSQWVNSVPPHVGKLNFMYEVVCISSKSHWSIYHTSSKCHWNIYNTSRKRRGTLRVVQKVERSSPTVSIRCPTFGSNSEIACHSRITDCPGTTIPMEERRQLNLSHCRQNSSNRSSSEQIRKDRTACRTVWNILSRIDRTKREWMDGWNIFLKWCPSNIEGSFPLPES